MSVSSPNAKSSSGAAHRSSSGPNATERWSSASIIHLCPSRLRTVMMSALPASGVCLHSVRMRYVRCQDYYANSMPRESGDFPISFFRLRSPRRPLVATQHDAGVLKRLLPQVLRCFCLAHKELGWPTPGSRPTECLIIETDVKEKTS